MNLFIGINIVLMMFLILIYKLILYFGDGGLFVGLPYMIAKLWLHFIGPIMAFIFNFLMLFFIEEPMNNLHFMLFFLSIPALTILYLILKTYLTVIHLTFHERKIKKTVMNYLKEIGAVEIYSIDRVVLFKKKVYSNKLILKVENKEKHQEYKDKYKKDLKDKLYNEYEIQILFSNEGS